MSNATVNVVFGTNGVRRMYSRTRGVAAGKEAAVIVEAVMLGIRLAHEAVREHFAEPATQDVKPLTTSNVFVCACGEQFTSAEEAIDHVERDHASERIRLDIDKLEDTIQGMVTPNPLPAAPEPTVTVSDRTFGEELQAELMALFADLGEGEGSPAERAKALIEFCGWNEVKALNYSEYKVRLIDLEPEKKIPAKFLDDYICALALFLRQVGKLSKFYQGDSR